MKISLPRPRAVPNLSLVNPQAQPDAAQQALARGDVLFEAGSFATPCRIVSGAVRMDPQGAHHDAVLLALPGDLLGLDALIGLPQSGSARAIVATVIEPLPVMPDLAWRGLLVRSLIAQQNRSAELSLLRTGSAAERVGFLLRVLAGQVQLSGRPAGDAPADPCCELPTLADMAAVTGSAWETVSRVISAMRRCGLLLDAQPDTHGRHVRLAPTMLAKADAFPIGMTRSRVHDGAPAQSAMQ